MSRQSTAAFNADIVVCWMNKGERGKISVSIKHMNVKAFSLSVTL
jgi:hypothetical protein